jgi:hypothetical protein
MTNGETDLEMAMRHVREAEAHMARQIALIGEMRRGGHPTSDAEALLKVYEQLLGQYREHLEILRRSSTEGRA